MSPDELREAHRTLNRYKRLSVKGAKAFLAASLSAEGRPESEIRLLDDAVSRMRSLFHFDNEYLRWFEAEARPILSRRNKGAPVRWEASNAMRYMSRDGKRIKMPAVRLWQHFLQGAYANRMVWVHPSFE